MGKYLINMLLETLETQYYMKKYMFVHVPKHRLLNII